MSSHGEQSNDGETEVTEKRKTLIASHRDRTRTTKVALTIILVCALSVIQGFAIPWVFVASSEIPSYDRFEIVTSAKDAVEREISRQFQTFGFQGLLPTSLWIASIFVWIVFYLPDRNFFSLKFLVACSIFWVCFGMFFELPRRGNSWIATQTAAISEVECDYEISTNDARVRHRRLVFTLPDGDSVTVEHHLRDIPEKVLETGSGKAFAYIYTPNNSLLGFSFAQVAAE